MHFLALFLIALLAGPTCAQSAAEQTGKAAPDFDRDVALFLDSHCVRCHGGKKPKGGLALDAYQDGAALARDRRLLDKLAQVIRDHEMPPPGRPRLTDAEIEPVTAWLEAALVQASGGKKDPGRVTIRRLNRVEYNNTIRDLVGVHFQPADDFPSDDVGYGFDNIGDVLSMPPILMEKYLAAAEKIVDHRVRRSPRSRKRILIANRRTTSPTGQMRPQDYRARSPPRLPPAGQRRGSRPPGPLRREWPSGGGDNFERGSSWRWKPCWCRRTSSSASSWTRRPARADAAHAQ